MYVCLLKEAEKDFITHTLKEGKEGKGHQLFGKHMKRIGSTIYSPRNHFGYFLDENHIGIKTEDGQLDYIIQYKISEELWSEWELD